jgi:Cu/Ag efflux pump CusA
VAQRYGVQSLLTSPLGLLVGIAVVTIGTSSESQQLGGTLAEFGVAVRNGTLLVERYRRGEREGAARDQWPAVRGARDQLMPMLSACIATAGALLPFAVLRPAPAPRSSTGCPLVVLAGLVTSILINLFHLAVTPHPHRPDPGGRSGGAPDFAEWDSTGTNVLSPPEGGRRHDPPLEA